MGYRISYYLKSEVIEGRAPRHTAVIDVANNVADAKTKAYVSALEAGVKKGDFVVHGAYYASQVPAPSSPGYIYLSNEDRAHWYGKVAEWRSKERKCKLCEKNPLEKFQQVCRSCKATIAASHVKRCKDCGTPITHRHRCDACADTRTALLAARREDMLSTIALHREEEENSPEVIVI